jgi:hypothetical protein
MVYISARDVASGNPSMSRPCAWFRKKRGCPSNPSLSAGKEGVELLKKDIADGTNTLVIAACSRRVNFDTFRFDGCIVDRVNLREGVVWSHPRSEFPALDRRGKRRRGQLRPRSDDGRRLSSSMGMAG